jgi:hypothetical protein
VSSSSTSMSSAFSHRASSSASQRVPCTAADTVVGRIEDSLGAILQRHRRRVESSARRGNRRRVEDGLFTVRLGLSG